MARFTITVKGRECTMTPCDEYVDRDGPADFELKSSSSDLNRVDIRLVQGEPILCRDGHCVPNFSLTPGDATREFTIRADARKGQHQMLVRAFFQTGEPSRGVCGETGTSHASKTAKAAGDEVATSAGTITPAMAAGEAEAVADPSFPPEIGVLPMERTPSMIVR